MDRIIKTKIFIILLMVRAMPTPLEMIIGQNSILKNIFYANINTFQYLVCYK